MKKMLNIKGLKYAVVLVAFAVYIVFLDDYSLVSTSRLKKEVHRLHDEETTLREAIVSDSINAASLRDNLDAKEHYGRENYYMKRPDEDIFVLKK